MNKVVKILMERDGLTRQEATEQVKEAKEIMLNEQDDSVIEELLGLEPDYIFDVLEI